MARCVVALGGEGKLIRVSEGKAGVIELGKGEAQCHEESGGGPRWVGRDNYTSREGIQLGAPLCVVKVEGPEGPAGGDSGHGASRREGDWYSVEGKDPTPTDDTIGSGSLEVEAEGYRSNGLSRE